MSRDTSRRRIEYVPSATACAALAEAAAIAGEPIGTQVLLDWLVLLGVWAARREQDRPPSLRSIYRAGSRRPAVRDRVSRYSDAPVPGTTAPSTGAACAAPSPGLTMPIVRAADVLKTTESASTSGLLAAPRNTV